MSALKLTSTEQKVLLAMRAGPMSVSELGSRFTSGLSLAQLLAKDLIEPYAGGYRITEAGKLACPSRRQLEKPIFLDEVDRKLKALPKTERKTEVIRTTKLDPAIIKSEHPMTEPTTSTKTKTLQILEMIEQFPNCSSADILKKLKISSPMAFIKLHVQRGDVITAQDEDYKRTYSLKDGVTAGEIYFNDHRPKKASSTPIKAKKTASTDPKLQKISAEDISIPVTSSTEESSARPAVDTVDEVINNLINVANSAALDKSAFSTQVGGDHYKKYGDYQPWKVLHKWLSPEELKGFMKGTVIAYLAREDDKGGHIDIEKAGHTIQIYLDLIKA